MDPIELERRAIDAENENMAFRKWTKRLEPAESLDLDRDVGQVAAEVASAVSCVDCGRCCTMLGLVAITPTEATQVAARLGMDPTEFMERHTTTDDEGLWLEGGPCPMLDGTACTVYEDRPAACRDFPYLDKPHFSSRTLFLISNTSVCPILYHTFDQLRARLPWRRRRKS